MAADYCTRKFSVNDGPVDVPRLHARKVTVLVAEIKPMMMSSAPGSVVGEALTTMPDVAPVTVTMVPLQVPGPGPLMIPVVPRRAPVTVKPLTVKGPDLTVREFNSPLPPESMREVVFPVPSEPTKSAQVLPVDGVQPAWTASPPPGLLKMAAGAEEFPSTMAAGPSELEMFMVGAVALPPLKLLGAEEKRPLLNVAKPETVVLELSVQKAFRQLRSMVTGVPPIGSVPAPVK